MEIRAQKSNNILVHAWVLHITLEQSQPLKQTHYGHALSSESAKVMSGPAGPPHHIEKTAVL